MAPSLIFFLHILFVSVPTLTSVALACPFWRLHSVPFMVHHTLFMPSTSNGPLGDSRFFTITNTTLRILLVLVFLGSASPGCIPRRGLLGHRMRISSTLLDNHLMLCHPSPWLAAGTFPALSQCPQPYWEEGICMPTWQMKHVLVISTCCITNHSKTQRFKTTNNLFSHGFCRSGIQVSLSWVPLAQGLSQGYSQGVHQGLSHLKAGLGEGLLSSLLAWLLASLRPSWSVRLETSVSFHLHFSAGQL